MEGMKRCPQCKQEFFDWPAVFDHQKSAHAVKAKYHQQCHYCPEVFDEQKNFYSHLLICPNKPDNSKPVVPPPGYFELLDQKQFAGSWDLSDHVLTVNEDGTCIQEGKGLRTTGKWRLEKDSRDYSESKDESEKWRWICFKIDLDEGQKFAFNGPLYIQHLFIDSNPFVKEVLRREEKSPGGDMEQISVLEMSYGLSGLTIPWIFRTTDLERKARLLAQQERDNAISRKARERGGYTKCGIPLELQVAGKDCCLEAVKEIVDQVWDSKFDVLGEDVKCGIVSRVSVRCMAPPGMTENELKLAIAEEISVCNEWKATFHSVSS